MQTQLQLGGLENDMALKVGDVAPDFELPAITGERQITMRSCDYLGRQNLVVAFHPLDWTPT
jgi:peroxiredoxin